MIFEKVKALLADQLQIDPSEIKMESRLFEDLHADSANVMIMVMDVEEAFNITVDDDALPNIRTVGDVVEYLEKTVG
ncbi:MAG: acyl carrier protein [Clostridia bacterium]|nr:acyl carrier protein [Clostridia bacterium]